jgi:2-keto-4-pentenoate hydratase/2-oxohepta-3-ene-1,7-dioic acid hydratase in catechol pathway
VELGFVLGRTGKNIASEDALGYIFGYTVINDVSARDLQNRHQQFFKGKSLDGTCPMGPCIVTADELRDAGDLALALRLNGKTMQDSRTRDLVFDIPTIIAGALARADGGGGRRGLHRHAQRGGDGARSADVAQAG